MLNGILNIPSPSRRCRFDGNSTFPQLSQKQPVVFLVENDSTGKVERKNPVKSSDPFATTMAREPCSQVARLSGMHDFEGIIENTLPDPLTLGGDATGRGSGEWGRGWGQEVARLLQRKAKVNSRNVSFCWFWSWYSYVYVLIGCMTSDI